MIRFLIRLLANNEQLVQKLSESYPMRRAAQIIVRLAYSGKYYIEAQQWDKKMNPEQFRSFMKDISRNFQNQIKEAQEEIKRKMK